jgi:hypothetical protein
MKRFIPDFDTIARNVERMAHTQSSTADDNEEYDFFIDDEFDEEST